MSSLKFTKLRFKNKNSLHYIQTEKGELDKGMANGLEVLTRQTHKPRTLFTTALLTLGQPNTHKSFLNATE